MKHAFLRGLCLAASIFLPATVQAQAPAQAPLTLQSPLPVNPDLKVGKLDNGLTYYIQKNAAPAHRAELRLVIKAGSVVEDDDQLGLAHVVEHMAFNGSTHFNKAELVSYLQSMGVRLGADLNAQTGFDQTVYILPIPLDRPDNLKLGMQVLEDWAHGLKFDPDMIEKERAIVLEELRLHKGPQDRILRQIAPHVFHGSRYAQRLPGGSEEVLRTFKPETLRRFYQDWYRPDLMAVIVVGDIDPDQAHALVQQHFGHLKNPATPRPRDYPALAGKYGTQAVTVTDPETAGSSVSIRYPLQPVGDLATVGAFRDEMIRQMYFRMMNQRLANVAGEQRAPWYSATASMGLVTPRYFAYEATATLGERSPLAAVSALVQEHKRVREHGFTLQEVALAAKNLQRRYENAYLERKSYPSASYAREYINHFVNGEPAPGVAFEYRLFKGLLPSIRLDEINDYAKRLIPADTASLVQYVGMPGAKLPSEDELLATASAAARKRVYGYDARALEMSLLERKPQAGKIVSEEHDTKLGLITMRLSNGVKVILKPTDLRADEVLFSAVRFGGQSQADERDITNARLAGEIVSSWGLPLFTARNTSLASAGKNASIKPSLTSYSDELSGSASADDVETMLQMAWLHFQDMLLLEGRFFSAGNISRNMVRKQQSLPEVQFEQARISALYNDHPRAPREANVEDYKQVNANRALEFFRKRFSSAKDMTFIVVGAIDLPTLRPLLETYLGSLATREIATTYRDVFPRPASGVIKREVHGGTEPKSTIALSFAGPAEYSPAEQLRVNALREIMNLRMNAVLREKMQVIYAGGASGGLRAHPFGQYSLNFTLPTGPEHVERAIVATFAEIEQLRAKGPAADELEKVRTNWLLEHQRRLTDNSYWVNHLRAVVLGTREPHDLLDYEARVKALNVADIQAAASRYLKPDNYVQVVLNPAAGPADSAPHAN